MNYQKEMERQNWRKSELKSQMKTLYESAKEAGQPFNEDEQTKFDELDAQCKLIDTELATLATMARIDVAEDQTVPDQNQLAEDAAQTAEEPKFESLGEQLQAVAKFYDSSGRILDPSLGAATGANEGIGSEGGFLVQTDFAAELIKPVFDGGAIASRVRTIPISANSNGLKINAVDQTSRATGSRWGGVQGYWIEEAGTKTPTKPKYRKMELNLKKLIGLYWATDELIQDAAALGAVATEAFTDEFTFLVEDSIVNGSGAGLPLGIMNAPAMVQVSKETNQAAKTIIAENVENMYARLHTRSVGNAIWLINQNCWPQIFRFNHSVGTGGVPMFIPAGGLTDTPAGMLLGRPIVPVEYCQTLGTAGDIILADLSQYLMIDKGGTQTASSIHVNFTTDETVFRFVYRADGQPTWNSALTPYKGGSGSTISPFIRLATRS